MLGPFFRLAERFMQFLSASYVPLALILPVLAADIYRAATRCWRDALATRGRATVYGLSVPLLIAGIVPDSYLLTYYAIVVVGPVP